MSGAVVSKAKVGDLIGLVELVARAEGRDVWGRGRPRGRPGAWQKAQYVAWLASPILWLAFCAWITQDLRNVPLVLGFLLAALVVGVVVLLVGGHVIMPWVSGCAVWVLGDLSAALITRPGGTLAGHWSAGGGAEELRRRVVGVLLEEIGSVSFRPRSIAHGRLYRLDLVGREDVEWREGEPRRGWVTVRVAPRAEGNFSLGCRDH